MKKTNLISGNRVFLLSLAASALTGCMSQMSESVTDKSRGLNGSFEHVKNGLPVNWLAYTAKTVPDSDFELSFDTTQFKEGKQSLKFDVRKCSDKGGRFSPGISQEIPVTSGQEYHIRFWVKNTGSEFSIAISGVNAFEGAKGPSFRSAELIQDWHPLEYTYKIPKAMERLKIDVSVLKPGTFWIDDLKIEKAGS